MPWTIPTSLVAGGFALLGLGIAATAQAEEQNRIHMELKDGTVVIKLRPDLAPNHVARISELIRQGFYDGLKFHRVIDGFMAQTGDPLGNGTGGSGQNIAAEFSDFPHIRGTVSMARAQDPNSADSQFFMCSTKPGSSMASTRSGERSRRGWNTSTPSSAAIISGTGW